MYSQILFDKSYVKSFEMIINELFSIWKIEITSKENNLRSLDPQGYFDLDIASINRSISFTPLKKEFDFMRLGSTKTKDYDSKIFLCLCSLAVDDIPSTGA